MDIASNLASANDHEPSLPTQWRSQWIGGIGLLTLLAFTWLPNSYSYMVGWPYILIWQGAFFILGIYTIRVCRQFSIPFGRLGYGLDGVVALTIFAATLSTLNAQFRAVACWNLLLIINYVVFLYLSVNWLRHGKLTRHLLWAILSVTGIATSIVSLALWRPNVGMWLSQDFNAAIRNAQPLGHHNFVGGYELLLLPIVCSFTLSQQGWRRSIGIVATAIVAIALYASGSRGALLGASVLGLFCLGLGLAFSNYRDRRRWIVASCALLLIMTLVLSSNPRIRSLFTITTAATENQKVSIVSIADGPAKDRIFMVEAARNIFVKHPILGVGPGNLSRVYNTYRPAEAGSGLTLVQQLHNTPAQIIAELGILGFSAYFGLLIGIVRLGFILYKLIPEQRDRTLLYGIAASWLGYGISSLSDYQLENIGITVTLVITVALLISLADEYQPHPPSLDLSTHTRRMCSMLLMVLLASNLQIWGRTNAGLYLAYTAIQDVQGFDFVSADEKWRKANKLVPWDPTYPALASEAVLELMASLEKTEDIQELRLLAIGYCKEAVKAAPNDPWFNQNLAALLLDNGNAAAAEPYAQNAVNLSPRSSNNYTYYTLAISLLMQNKTDESIEAFALEALTNPVFLTTNVWNQVFFLPIRTKVLDKTLNSYQKILSETDMISAQYQWLYEQWAMLSWWHDYPVSEQAQEKIRPLARAMLLSKNNPQKSLQLIDEHISVGQSSKDLQLLQARLSPERYLPKLLKNLEGTDEEKTMLEKSVKRNETMQTWLSEVTTAAESQIRYGSSFAYRNLFADNIRKILYPRDIKMSILPTSIGLFQDAPREYPQMDQYIANVRAKHL